jgi:hypothetical protein
VINIRRSSLSAGFNDVPELIVKIMFSVYFYFLGPHITFIIPTGYFPDIKKLKYNLWLKRVMNNI